MNGQVCVVGSFMMDLVAFAPRRPLPGETLRGTGFGMRLGGKGFNQAVAAARAGARVSMVGLLGGDDFGAAFRAALADEGVDGMFVDVDEPSGTGVGLPVIDPDGQNSIIIVPRANEQMSTAQIERAAAHLTAADVLLLQLELPIEVAAAAARVAKSAGTTVVLNPAPAAIIPDELLALVDVLVPNEVELRELTGRSATGQIDEAVRDLQSRYRTSIVVTLGAKGAVVVEPEGTVTEIAAVSVVPVDTVGAGDTFCGYLGAGLAAGSNLVDAARWANRAAAVAVTRYGSAASAPHRHETDAHVRELREMEIRP